MRPRSQLRGKLAGIALHVVKVCGRSNCIEFTEPARHANQWIAILGAPSISRTLKAGFADSLLATTQPAEPAPTIT